MKILIICSKKFYGQISDMKSELEKLGHTISLPNCFDDPTTEDRYRQLGRKEHAEFKAKMFRQSEQVISDNDAVLVINAEKNGVKNYIGGATFLEMYDAFRLNKKIFLYNDIPDGILHDEIKGFDPVLISTDLNKVV